MTAHRARVIAEIRAHISGQKRARTAIAAGRRTRAGDEEGTA